MGQRRSGAATSDESYAEFVASRGPRLLHAAELLVGSGCDAEDVVQAVLTRMYPRWSRIEQDDPVGYARRAIVNDATDRWRRTKGREVLGSNRVERADPVDRYEPVAKRDLVSRLLGALTARERAVVVLRYSEDFS